MPQDYPQAVVPPPACRAAAESGVLPLDRRRVGMSEFWHKMGCCVVAKPPPVLPDLAREEGLVEFSKTLSCWKLLNRKQVAELPLPVSPEV
ncbi:hypothetical protein GBF38_010590 [Nibea albiflora]|uniref:Uncharacterized protein n=1 Tax=Nibea albiflora TaxID=240163 RepID=A0ACB7ERU8_NIBAL|nr:hypothetical protein GBF38_010590 [Nibea albiflora]